MKAPVTLIAAVLAIALFSVRAPAQYPYEEQRDSEDGYAPGDRYTYPDTAKCQISRYDCPCAGDLYAQDLSRKADQAIGFLRHRAARWRRHERLAMVLDIDETSLSNYEQMKQGGFTNDSRARNDWVEWARAPAIPGTLRLYREAQRLGVRVFFLSDRPSWQRKATERNLRRAGFHGWDGLILRGRSEAWLTSQQFKSDWRARIARHYRIVLNVGDKRSDLRGWPEAEYSVKYPDPAEYLRASREVGRDRRSSSSRDWSDSESAGQYR